MAQVVSELITKFSFQGSTKPLIDYNSSLGRSIKLLGAMGAAFGAATFAVAKWASGVSQSLQPLFDLSEQTGVAVASIQELSFVAEQSGSSAQALESSLSGLGAKIGEAAQKGSEEFSRLGISVRNANGDVKSTDTILGELGSSFKRLGLSMSEQQGYAEALGIDPSLISMLSQTSAETEKLKQRARDLGITLSPEDIKGLKEYNESISEMNSAMSGLKNLIAVAIVPELEDLAEGFSDLLAKNNEWIVDGVKATVEFVVDLVDALKRLAPFILAAGAAFAIATIGTSGFAAALGFVLSPAVLIAAGILAIALVLDDLIVAFRGGDSVIADFFEEFFGWDIQPVLKMIVEGFKEAFKVVSNLVIGLFDGIVKIFKGIGDILSGNFSEGFEKIGEGFMEIIDSWVEAFRSVFGEAFNWLKQKALDILPDWAVKLIGGAGDAASGMANIAGDVASGAANIAGDVASGAANIAGDVGNWVGDAGNWVGGVFGGEDMIPKSQAMQPGGTVTNIGGASSSIEQNVNMEIRTSDPERAGRAAADNLQRQMDDAHTQTLRRSH